MANETIYPYGTNGQLPSSIGVINDLTTGGADKALSAEMGKELNTQINGSTKTKSSSSTYNKYYVITDNVLDKDNPVSSLSYTQVNSTIIDVVAGQKITWTAGTYQIAAAHKFTFAACDDENNVLFSSADETGEYTIVEDGYIVVQGWRDYSVTIVSEGLADEIEALKGNVADNLTTDDATKALSAKQGKKLGDDIYGDEQSYTQTSANGQHNISNDVLSPTKAPNVNAGSLLLPVTAGQLVTWGESNAYQLAYVFAATDSEYNVLFKTSNTTGSYTVTEDGYVVVQSWTYDMPVKATVKTLGIIDTKADKTEIPALVSEQTELLKYSDDLVAQCKFYGGGKITSGVLAQDYYAKYSGYIRIAPATKMLAKKVSSMYADFPIISYYSEPIEKAYISEEDVTTSDISSTGTIIIAPDTAKYMRLCFGLYGNSYDSFTIQLENASFLRCLTEIQRPFKFILPKYVDGVTGRNVYLFTSQFMDGVEGYYLRSGGSIRRVPGGEDVWSLSSETNVVLCDNDGSLREGFTRNGDSSLQHFNLKVRLNSKTNGDGSTKGILFIGDSLMEKGPSVREAYDLLAADGDWTIQKIGTSKNMGVGEFTQGWKYSDFIGSSSPFYINGALNFQAYVAAKHPSYTGGIDYVIIALGTNDVNGTGISTIIANAKTLIDAILDEDTGYPNAKIAVGLPSLGAPYASTNNDTDFTNHYSFKKKMRALNTALISNFDNGKYNANVTCMAHGAYLYAYESYGHTDVAVNQYCETTARQFGSFMKDGVSADTIHPYHIGFKQWGYAFYCKIRAFLAGNL